MCVSHLQHLWREFLGICSDTVQAEPLTVEDAAGGGNTDNFVAGGTVAAQDQRLRAGVEGVTGHVSFFQQPTV